jgi:hypothetical protein
MSKKDKEEIHKPQPDRMRRNIITQHLIGELAAVDPLTNITKARTLVMRLVEMATLPLDAAGRPQADLGAIREIYDRVEGKARQQVEVSHDGDVTVRSAAVSVVDELIAEVLRQHAGRDHKDVLPN